MSSNLRNSTKTVILAPNPSTSDVGGGGTFLINLPSNSVQQRSTNGSMMVPACVRTSSSMNTTTSAAAVGGRVGNTFVLFPVKQLQRNVVVAESSCSSSSSNIQTIIPEVQQKPQILSLAVQQTSAGIINNHNQQQFTPVFFVSSSKPLTNVIDQSGCGVVYSTKDNIDEQNSSSSSSSRFDMGRNRESPNAPPSFYEQRLKLERAKMGDILKHKIEHRPNKQQLVSQHILLDSSADPSIVDKLQQLKKCKLADSLNEKLAHRPGPLELVQENILHVDAALEQAVKDGRLQFKPTSAGLIQKHPHPVFGNVQDSTTLAPVQQQQQQDIVVEQVSSAIMLSTVSSSTASSSMLNGVGHNFLQQDNLSTVDRCSTIQMNSSTSNMKSGLTESNDRNLLNSTAMSGIFVGSSNPQQFYVSTNNNQHSSSSSSTCSSPLLTPNGGGGCFDKSSTMNGFTLISTNSVVDCSSASSTSVADRVPIIVENLLSSSSSTKSKPKKSKSKTSTSSASSSSCQVAVVPTTATISANANNCTTLLTTTNGCSNSNSNACIGSITLSNGVGASTTNNCSNIVTCVNSLPKTKVIKFHEYKGPTSMIGGQKTGLTHNITNGSGKFFLVPSNGLISGVGKQTTTTTTTNAVFDNSDGKMVQGIMISCPQNGITVTNGNQLMNGSNDFMDGTLSSTTTTVTQFDDMNNGKLSETSYDLLLQQQQLMLQWQLELQQKYPNTTVQLVPSVSASSTSTSDMIFADVVDSNNQQNFLMQSNLQQHLNVLHRSDSPTQSGFGTMSVQSSPGLNVGSTAAASSMSMPLTPAPLIRSESDTNGNCATKTTSNNQNSSSSSNAKPVEKLEDMKVNDLKIECKKRNLPVSGSKPHLLERLKPYEETILSSLKERTANLNKLSSAFDDDSTKPATASTTNASQNGGALPPISFLSSSANLNLFNSTTSSSSATTTDEIGGSVYLQTSPASSCQSEVAGGNCNGVSGGYITNGHSLSVDHSAIPSNYSSPGIDLSVLSFGNGNNLNQNGNILSTNNNNNNNNVVECFTFSSPTNFDSISNNRNNICDQNNSIHDQTVVINGIGYNAVLPVHSVVGVNENPSDDANDQRVPILSLHEDMIRGQQSKINELQKELQRSQDILKQQQQLILAAKKVQAEAVEQGNNGGVSDNILSQLDTKQMQKMHIQLFLQQKLQQQQLQQQLNVQRELVATQQRLEEEMHVHQAVTEVVRLLRQEPRVALLVLHLLKKHQSDQQNQTSPPSEEQQIEKSPQKNDIRSPNSIADVAIGPSTGSSTPLNTNGGNSAVLSSSSAQSSPKHAPSKKYSSSSVNGESTTKPKNGGGSIKKSSLQHSSNSSNNSNSSAPKTPKSVGGGGSGAPIDMEEIFRTVLDYATKATAATSTKGNSNIGADDEMNEMICSDRKTSFVVESNQISSNLNEILPTAALPGCDQIMPQRPAVTTENENGNVNGVVGVGNLRQLFNFDHNQLTSPTDASYIYTKNEAFDDLMEVLRNNGAPHGVNNVFGNGNVVTDLQQSSPPSIPQTTTTSPPSTATTISNRGHDQQQQTAINSTASATFLNAFSAQDMADLLSSDWFNVDSVLNAGGCVGVNNVCFDVAHTPQGISTPNSFSSLDKSPMKNDSQLRVTPMDSMFSNPVDNSEQMDWLDLILPSPGVDLPANPPCPVSAGGRSSSLSQTPMETDCMSSSSLDSLITCRRDPLLLSGRNSVGNPMLAMSGDCL